MDVLDAFAAAAEQKGEEGGRVGSGQARGSEIDELKMSDNDGYDETEFSVRAHLQDVAQEMERI